MIIDIRINIITILPIIYFSTHIYYNEFNYKTVTINHLAIVTLLLLWCEGGGGRRVWRGEEEGQNPHKGVS